MPYLPDRSPSYFYHQQSIPLYSYPHLKENAQDRLLLECDYVAPIDIMYVVVGETNGQGLVILPQEWPYDNIVRDSHIQLWTFNQSRRGLQPHQYFESSRYRLIKSKVLKDSDILPDLLTQPEELGPEFGFTNEYNDYCSF